MGFFFVGAVAPVAIAVAPVTVFLFCFPLDKKKGASIHQVALENFRTALCRTLVPFLDSLSADFRLSTLYVLQVCRQTGPCSRVGIHPVCKKCCRSEVLTTGSSTRVWDLNFWWCSKDGGCEKAEEDGQEGHVPCL